MIDISRAYKQKLLNIFFKFINKKLFQLIKQFNETFDSNTRHTLIIYLCLLCHFIRAQRPLSKDERMGIEEILFHNCIVVDIPVPFILF